MLPVMATRYRPIGLGYMPWPLGQEAQTDNGDTGSGFAPTDVAPIVGAAGGTLAQIIAAIRGVPAGMPPGTYPPGYVEPFPWGTVLLIGGVVIGGIYLATRKRTNPRRRRRYRVYRRRR